MTGTGRKQPSKSLLEGILTSTKPSRVNHFWRFFTILAVAVVFRNITVCVFRSGGVVKLISSGHLLLVSWLPEKGHSGQPLAQGHRLESRGLQITAW